MMPTLPDLSTTIAGITETLEGKDSTAYTLTVLVQMGPVVDAHYVWSTPKARRMFGRDLGAPGQEWQSYTLPRDVCYRSALAGISRIRMRDVAQTYITPIIHGRTKQEREVKKTVQLHRTREAILYLTKIEPVPVHVDCRHIRDIALDVAEAWDYTHVFMSEIDEMIELGAFELVKQRDYCKIDKAYAKNNLTTSSEYISIDGMENASPKLTFSSETTIVKNYDDEEVLVYLGNGPGESFWIDDGVSYGFWIHRCKFCNFVWRSDFVRPDVCRRPATKEKKCRRVNWWRGAPDVLSPSDRAKLARNPGRKRRVANQ